MLQVDTRPDGVVALTLHRPDKRHALNPALLEAFAGAVGAAQGVRAFLVRSSGGPAFCAGYDVDELKAPKSGERLADDRVAAAFNVLSNHGAPSVAVIDGAAFGAGVELACACDFRIASKRATFCVPAARLGIVYGHEGLSRVANIVGFQKARRMFLRGDVIDADTALSWGLVDVLSDDPALEGEAWAAHLAAQAPLAVEGMKVALRVLSNVSTSTEALDALHALKVRAAGSDDVREGLLARKEKRPPRFLGR